MRNVIFAINITLDGCCDHTKFNPDEETFEYFTHLTRDADTFLYGRKTYQLMVPYWPDVAKSSSGQTKADYEFAKAFDANKIIVFSQSLASAEGEKTSPGRQKQRSNLPRHLTPSTKLLFSHNH